MEAITNLLSQNATLQNEIGSLQKQLKAKIHDVPPEKVAKYILIGATIGIAGYWVYQYTKEKKKKI